MMGTVLANIFKCIPPVLVQTDTCVPPELSKLHTQHSIHGTNNNISKSQPNFDLSNFCFILMASSRKAFESISLYLGAVSSRLMQNLLQILHILMSAILLDCKNCRPYSTQKHLPDVATLPYVTLTTLN